MPLYADIYVQHHLAHAKDKKLQDSGVMLLNGQMRLCLLRARMLQFLVNGPL